MRKTILLVSMMSFILGGCVLTAQPIQHKPAPVEMQAGQTEQFWVTEFPPAERVWYLDGVECTQEEGFFTYTPGEDELGRHTLEVRLLTFGMNSGSHTWTIEVSAAEEAAPEVDPLAGPRIEAEVRPAARSQCIDNLCKLLQTESELAFLAKLDDTEIELLTSLIRARLLDRSAP